MLERPGRMAAVGSAAVICLLSVSGALGLAPASLSSGSSPPEPDSHGVGGTTLGAPGGAGNGTDASSRQASRHSSPTPAAGTRHRAQRAAPPPASGAGRRVVFDESAQRVWLVDADDSVARTYLVSGSKYDNLDLGTYHVSSRSRHATAYNSNETMQYMVRFAQGRTSPIGFHSIPAFSDGRLVESRTSLGTPQSDGCIRQWITDARALWAFASLGTTVVVRP